MKLHEDPEQFHSLIQSAAAEFGLKQFQIEKDYYVSLVLKNLVKEYPSVVFKGGTSLSKCYDVIKRFSEDLDLTLPLPGSGYNLSRTEKRNFKATILQVISNLNFEILNEDKIGSGRAFNEYQIGYEKKFASDGQASEHILIETNIAYQPFPYEKKKVSNYITKFVDHVDADKESKEKFFKDYDMYSFIANVQSIERTFLDKLFAICDYFEDKESRRYSRHLYDLHKIWHSQPFNYKKTQEILLEVIMIRRGGRDTHSANTGYEIKKKLREIIETDFYKNDYGLNTREFLAEEVKYEEVISSLEEILNSSLLPKTIK